MLPKRIYNLLLGLFPIVFAIHNLEEWFVFNTNIGSFVEFSPKFISQIIAKDPPAVSSIFRTALIVATIIPLLVTLLIWNKLTDLSIKILLVIAFVSFINAISHIFSSVILGFITPGFITGILVCIPYSASVFIIVNKHTKLSCSLYLSLALGSIVVFALGLGLSWLIGVMFT